jgi:beta-xylosidase
LATTREKHKPHQVSEKISLKARIAKIIATVGEHFQVGENTKFILEVHEQSNFQYDSLVGC